MHKEPQSIIQMSEKGNMAAVKKGSKYDVRTYSFPNLKSPNIHTFPNSDRRQKFSIIK